jgi:hypothetical protein
MVAENIMEYCITFYIKKEKNISMHGDPCHSLIIRLVN